MSPVVKPALTISDLFKRFGDSSGDKEKPSQKHVSFPKLNLLANLRYPTPQTAKRHPHRSPPKRRTKIKEILQRPWRNLAKSSSAFDETPAKSTSAKASVKAPAPPSSRRQDQGPARFRPVQKLKTRQASPNPPCQPINSSSFDKSSAPSPPFTLRRRQLRRLCDSDDSSSEEDEPTPRQPRSRWRAPPSSPPNRSRSPSLSYSPPRGATPQEMKRCLKRFVQELHQRHPERVADNLKYLLDEDIKLWGDSDLKRSKRPKKIRIQA